jgi:DNA-binding transcriptional ArsR family regulator
MVDSPDFAAIAALLGAPARGRMLQALMDGRALTATELAIEGDVTPSTASSHLARLTEAGLISIVKQGRHRYFRIAGPEVAALVERLTSLASGDQRDTSTGPRDAGLRSARVCYDHLAGRAGVNLFERLQAQGRIAERDGALILTPGGEAWAGAFGIDLTALRAQRRPLCLPCLDWSERREHLAGAVGAAILERLLDLRFAHRETSGRAVTFSARGAAFLEHLDPKRFAGRG